MRDSLLAVSGALDPTIGGRPVPITEPPFSPRRTVYGFIDRQNLDGLYRTFDFAVPDATSPRRFVTTVPQQALFLMNSPFLHEQARRLGRPSVAQAGEAANRAAGTRDPAGASAGSTAASSAGRPNPDELALATEFLRRQIRPVPAPRHGSKPQPRRASALALGAVGQVLLLTNEFMFVD